MTDPTKKPGAEANPTPPHSTRTDGKTHGPKIHYSPAGREHAWTAKAGKSVHSRREWR